MHTYSSEHKHTVNTHPEQWAANAVVLGEQLGVRCLAQGSHLSRGIEGGENAHYLLPLPDPKFEPTTSGYKSDALSIRPRLPIRGFKISISNFPNKNCDFGKKKKRTKNKSWFTKGQTLSNTIFLWAWRARQLYISPMMQWCNTCHLCLVVFDSLIGSEADLHRWVRKVQV